MQSQALQLSADVTRASLNKAKAENASTRSVTGARARSTTDRIAALLANCWPLKAFEQKRSGSQLIADVTGNLVTSPQSSGKNGADCRGLGGVGKQSDSGAGSQTAWQVAYAAKLDQVAIVQSCETSDDDTQLFMGAHNVAEQVTCNVCCTITIKLAISLA